MDLILGRTGIQGKRGYQDTTGTTGSGLLRKFSHPVKNRNTVTSGSGLVIRDKDYGTDSSMEVSG